MKARLHTLTTCILAALYGLVGVTGESLHYLVTEHGFFGRATALGKPAGYFHFHDPDHHVHFHQHAGHDHSHTSVAGIATAKMKRSASKGPGVSQGLQSWVHQPHACPMLSVISTLKLGLASHLPLNLEWHICEILSHEHGVCLVFDRALHALARGPPPLFFA